eukprot:1128928-Amphidinium_carterae.1
MAWLYLSGSALLMMCYYATSGANGADTRRLEQEVILEELMARPGCPVILGGDFNVPMEATVLHAYLAAE